MTSGQFSLVVALHNVASYVPAFLESLRTQRYPLKNLEIIVVDDGSTDNSAEVVNKWRAKHHPALRLVRQENAGPGAARNTGLRLARNKWVTFCDPDDVFHPRYFEAVTQFLQSDKNNSAHLLATRLVQFQDGTAIPNHTHPLGKKFRHGNALVNLDKNPEYIQLHGPTAFLRRDVLAQNDLEFDERIRPKFEDANLIGRYLAVVSEPIIGIVANAHYMYRRNRQQGSSLVAGTWADARAYEELPRFGYLGMLQEVKRRRGSIPTWAQYMVLYDLVWLYNDDKKMHSHTASATLEQQSNIHELLKQIISHIDEDTIARFGIVTQGWIFHNVLRTYYKEHEQMPPIVQKWVHDNLPGTVRYSYLFQETHPEEAFFVDGIEVQPLAAKVRDHQILGRTLIRERIFVLPVGKNISVNLDGKIAKITRDRGVPKQIKRYPTKQIGMELEPAAVLVASENVTLHNKLVNAQQRLDSIRDNLALRQSISGDGVAKELIHGVKRVLQRKASQRAMAQRSEADRCLVEKARQEPAASRYRDAWLLMDRIDQADDNAEHLYRYIMKERPDINAWFLLDSKSSDWDRLLDEGFRLVPYGSDESVFLTLNAAYKISSHANADVEFPVDRRRFGSGTAMFVFLQHGITKDDMSRWLNMKRISMMVTASQAEYDSIAGDGTLYGYTSQVVQLTGFPRHDALLEASFGSPLEQRQNILIAPTWREYLRDELRTATSDVERIERFEMSEFGRNWLQLLRSVELRDFCRDKDYNIVFLPHPELEYIIPLLELPDHVRTAAYSEISVQEQLVRAHTIITDYSSIAFDGAYAGAHVVYFQFDSVDIFGGGHVYRKGYFDYVQDGLGPVTTDAESAASAVIIRQILDKDGVSYSERVRHTFKHWDMNSSARTASAIENLNNTSSRD